jgi:hypothetical protein
MATKLILHLLVFTLLIAMCSVAHVSGEKIQSININKECIISIKHGAYHKPNVACFKICSKYDMAGMCSHMDSADEKIVSIANFVCLAHDCGKPVPPGTKCASKYFFLSDGTMEVLVLLLLCYYSYSVYA